VATVFISYAREDAAIAAELARALGARGWSVWWDPQIKAGETFDQVIERELDAASCIVVLWSTHSASSEWVKNEASAAVERGVLIPARIDAVRPPLEFRRRQTADLQGWRGDAAHPGFRALCEAIEHLTTAPRVATTTLARRQAEPSARLKWSMLALLAVCVAAALGGYAAFRAADTRTARSGSPPTAASTAVSRPDKERVARPAPKDADSAKVTNTSLPAGTFDFAWPGSDCWKVLRDGVEAARGCGMGTVTLQAGRYLVRDSSNEAFVPFEIDVEAGRTIRSDAHGGTFQFDWPGSDCWTVLRGSAVATTGCGAGKRVLQAGTYRVKPSSSLVFVPFDLSVRRGETTRSDATAGVLDLRWPGRECWKVYRGDVHAASGCGPGKHVLQAGSYRIEPSGARAFEPVAFELRRGETTRVGS
jgi:hypothetical protein